MANEDYKLRALEMAIDQARREGSADFQKAVAKFQTWFYNRIIGEVTEEVDQPKAQSTTLSLPTKTATGQAPKRP